jgi:hypothetical protein
MIEVVATLGEMVDSLTVMNRIINQPFAPDGNVQAYDRWTRTAKSVLSEVDEHSAYEVLRMKLVREFGAPNEKTGQHEFHDPDKYRAFLKAINELRAQERVVTVCKISEDEVDAQAVALGLSYAERFALDWLVPVAEPVG